jgi:hypothetical protein
MVLIDLVLDRRTVVAGPTGALLACYPPLRCGCHLTPSIGALMLTALDP